MKGLGIGRVVHYVDSNTIHLAAIVTAVINKEEGLVGLTVFPYPGWPGFESILSDGQKVLTFMVEFSEELRPGTWHWPEFVE